MFKKTKRLKVSLQTPNPILLEWIDNWLREAESDSASQKVLRNAKVSLCRYPLPIQSGKECAILKGFGKDLCEHIDKKMQVINKKNIANNTMENLENQIGEVIKIVNKRKQNEKVFKTKTQSVDKSFSKIEMHAGSFRIWLLVDTAETSGYFKSHLDQTRVMLNELRTAYEVRKLTIGDFAWVARNLDGQELVLPFIVERKRLDDLSKSIRDGRFHEQKHRLKNCGLLNVIYLIEDCNINNMGLPIESLQQAIVNTQIHTSFQTIYTRDHRETIIYLSHLTNYLIKHFHNKLLHTTDATKTKSLMDTDGLHEFNYFYKSSARNSALTIRELFIQQLLQLHSLSIDKASAIVSKYPTPRLLIEDLRKCESITEAKNLLSYIQYGKLMYTIGQKTSEALCDFYLTEF